MYNTEKLRLQPEWSIWDPDFPSALSPDNVCSSQAGRYGSQCSHDPFLLPAVATVSRMPRALQSPATVSPASQAGTGLSASSHVLQAPLVRGALGSAPAAGLESPVKQKLGTASAATLVG